MYWMSRNGSYKIKSYFKESASSQAFLFCFEEWAMEMT